MKFTEVMFALRTIAGFSPATETDSPNQSSQHNGYDASPFGIVAGAVAEL